MLIAFDQALNTTGFSVFSLATKELIYYNKFTTQSIAEADKLKEIRNNIVKLVEEYKPKKIAIEEIQLQKIPGTSIQGNVDTFKKLAHVQGVIYELMSELEIECETVSSSTWKSHCGIKGKNRTEQKRNAQLFIKKEYDIEAIQDICDSICIGKYIVDKNEKEVNWD